MYNIVLCRPLFSYPKKDLPNVKKIFRNLLIYTKNFGTYLKNQIKKDFLNMN